MKGVTGAGAYIEIGDNASPTGWTTVFENVSIGGFGQESGLIEGTHLLSTAKEYAADLPDGIQFPITVNFNADDATHAALLAAQAARSVKSMRYHFPPGASVTPKMITFSALILGFNLPAEVNQMFRATYTLKITGAISGIVAAA